MDTKGRIMLRVLMNAYNPKGASALLKFLPPDEVKSIQMQTIDSKDILPILYHPVRFIERMHYSWLKPCVDKFPAVLKPLVAAAMTPEQAKGFQEHRTATTALSGPVKTFILNQMATSLQAEQHLPLEYLPETDVFPLVKWTKKKLVHFCSFLGLYDLASEIRHIVDKRYLNNFYSCLSADQLYYLKICLHQKEKLIPPKLGIDPREQDCKKLKQIMQQRGLIRLGKALAGQHPDFVWYIAHTLDVGRGEVLLHYYKPEEIPQITTPLKLQVINLMNFLSKDKE